MDRPCLELDLSAGTGFQQAVWRALMQIPYGATQTYGELALRIGNPGASRAVGTACGRNPVPVLVRLSSGSGLRWQVRRLLQGYPGSVTC